MLIFVVLLLVGLNAATYVQKEKVADTEFAPNRSTYNSGSTGTQAFYALLSETGRNVTRWQTSLETLRSEKENRPSVFVIVGPLRREVSADEKTNLMEWVSAGGTLLLIDREPSEELLVTTAQWKMSVLPKVTPDLYVIDASDQKQMTAERSAQKAVQPSSFSKGVNAVQASRLASSIKLERYADSNIPKSGQTSGLSSTPSPTPYDFYSSDPPPPPVMRKVDEQSPDGRASDESGAQDEAPADLLRGEPAFQSPVVHFGTAGESLLVEAPFSEGRVIILSDPYIVSNNGINIVDNAQLAINLVTSRGGLIAFDEYHHGYGANNNRFFRYFEGTPVIAIFLQCGLVVALIFFSQSRRFARPIPEAEPSRLSKLEYVSAMAELQQRTGAYDLAIENIYTDFRRRAAFLVGLDNTTASRREIAERIAERTGGSAQDIDDLMFRCEDVIHGEPVRKNDTISIIERIREIEGKLGLKRAARKGL
ncbi:MAG TPA: DUF4350 domain-containing protein [Pyrinomonadaceae bacterium]|nr:DUF4350 domain-containing protein [Pyrinomonadaceae bacterium]